MDKSKIVRIEVKSITPKYYAQECPVCHGFGTLKHGTKVCQGCNGRGYIYVPTGEKDGSEYGRTTK